jgi:SAM-dependent methyltransferase
MNVMNNATRQRLLEVNRAFYATVAQDFDQTRAGFPAGWQKLYPQLPRGTPTEPVLLLDAGCGNGRFALALEELGVNACDIGVDADSALLALAAQNTAHLVNTQVQFVQADLAEPGWSSSLKACSFRSLKPGRAAAFRNAKPLFDAVVCFAALHHFPGCDLRLQVIKELASLIAPGGLLIFSHWQFLSSARFVQKQIDWQSVGLTVADVERGDALLPWQQGSYAIRYVHQIDEAEMQRLAQAAGLQVNDSFYADGKEGNLNLYTIIKQD